MKKHIKNFVFIAVWVFMATFLVPIRLNFAQNVPGQVSTPEPVPAATTGSTGGGSGSTTGTGGGTPTGAKNPPGASSTTPTLNLQPTPTDIPVVPIPAQNPVQQTASSDNQPETLLCTQDKCTASLNQAMGNEIIVMTILFFGSIIGGILWILALLSMRKGVMERESRRMERQTRLSLQKMVARQKVQAYGKYINSVIRLIDKLQHKNPIQTAEMREFQEGSVFIALHGSKHLCAINDHINSLILGGKPLPTADRLHLKLELGKTIRADLL